MSIPYSPLGTLILRDNPFGSNANQGGFTQWFKNYNNKWGGLNYGWLNTAIGAGADLAGNLINSNGLSTGAGNIMSGIGNVVGNIPGPIGWAGKGLALAGLAVNALWGHKFNDANIAAAESANAQRNNWLFGDYSNTDALLAGSMANVLLGNVNKSFIGKEGPFSNAVTNKMKLINNDRMQANLRANNSELNAYNNYLTGMVRNAIAGDSMGTVNAAASGGPLNMISGTMTPFGNRYFADGGFTHGSLFNNGFIEVNNGGSHELNPNQGVQYGVDPQGTPNMVEEGETILDDYVFSNRIKFPKRYKDEFALGGKIWKKTFADVSKMIAKESEERPNDPISQQSLMAMGSKLADIQEEVKAKQALDRMDPREVMAMLQQLAMMLQGGQPQMEGQQMMQDPYLQAMMMGELQPGLSSYGGSIHIKPSKRGTFTAAATKHGKSVLQFASQVLANPDNYSSAMIKKANFARNAANWNACGGKLHADGGNINLFLKGGNSKGLQFNSIEDMIKHYEGFRNTRYADGMIKKTGKRLYSIGYGFNDAGMIPNIASSTEFMTREVADEMLTKYIDHLKGRLKKVLGTSLYNQLTPGLLMAYIDTGYLRPAAMIKAATIHKKTGNIKKVANALSVKGFKERNMSRKNAFLNGVTQTTDNINDVVPQDVISNAINGYSPNAFMAANNGVIDLLYNPLENNTESSNTNLDNIDVPQFGNFEAVSSDDGFRKTMPKFLQNMWKKTDFSNRSLVMNLLYNLYKENIIGRRLTASLASHISNNRDLNEMFNNDDERKGKYTSEELLKNILSGATGGLNSEVDKKDENGNVITKDGKPVKETINTPWLYPEYEKWAAGDINSQDPTLNTWADEDYTYRINRGLGNGLEDIFYNYRIGDNDRTGLLEALRNWGTTDAQITAGYRNEENQRLRDLYRGFYDDMVRYNADVLSGKYNQADIDAISALNPNSSEFKNLSKELQEIARNKWYIDNFNNNKEWKTYKDIFDLEAKELKDKEDRERALLAALEISKFPTWMRYAPLAFSSIATLTDALGLTNKPDLTPYNQLVALSDRLSKTPVVRSHPVFQPILYTPPNYNYEQGAADNIYAAAIRNMNEVNNGNIGVTNAGNVVAMNNAMANRGKLRESLSNEAINNLRQVMDYNNRGAYQDAMASLDALKVNSANMLNAQRFGYSALADALRYYQSEQQAANAAKQLNLTHAVNSWANLGKENMYMNMINSNKAWDYIIDPSGMTRYKNLINTLNSTT